MLNIHDVLTLSPKIFIFNERLIIQSIFSLEKICVFIRG